MALTLFDAGPVTCVGLGRSQVWVNVVVINNEPLINFILLSIHSDCWDMTASSNNNDINVSFLPITQLFI